MQGSTSNPIGEEETLPGSDHSDELDDDGVREGLGAEADLDKERRTVGVVELISGDLQVLAFAGGELTHLVEKEE